MAPRHAIDTSFLYKFSWNVAISAAFSLSLFGSLFYFFAHDKEQYIVVIILVSFFISVLLDVFLRSYYTDRISVLYALTPLAGLIININFLASQWIADLSPLIGLFSVYVLVFMLFEYISFYIGPIGKTIIFNLHQLNKLITLSLAVLLIHTTVPERELFSILFLSTPYLIDNHLFFIGINMIVIVLIGPVVATSQLIFRSASLINVTKSLRRMTSWSLEHQVIEERLRNKVYKSKLEEKTILSGDLRGFTSFSLDNKMTYVLDVIEGFYEIVEQYVQEHNGFKPEFIADEFITFFQDTADGVTCAMKLRHTFRSYLQETGLSVGMGLNHGRVLEGFLGTKRSRKYTVFGDPVNIAVKVQKIARGDEILITQEVKTKVPHINTEFFASDHIVGLPKKVPVYTVMSRFTESKDYVPQEERFVVRLKERLHQYH